MILRKPYAFLIKYFKLINLFLGIALIYLSFKTNMMLDFFRTYIASGWYQSNGELTVSYIGIDIIFDILAIIIFSGLVIFLFNEKKKPIKFYSFTLTIVGITAVVYVFSYLNLDMMQGSILSPTRVRAIRDLLFMASLTHYPLIIFAFLRATGFDLRNFEFGQDIKDLEIEVDDQEEFEVEFGIDTNNLIRKFRNRKRYLKYAIYDNIALVILTASTTIVLLLIFFAISFLSMEKIYKENNSVPIYPFIVTINNSFVSNKNFAGYETAEDDQTYIVLNVTVENESQYTREFSLTSFDLVYKEKPYDEIYNKYVSFVDFGPKLHSKIFLAGEGKDFILVYQVEEKIDFNDIIFRHSENLGYYESPLDQKYKTIKVNPDDLSEITDSNNYNLNEKILLGKSILKGSSIEINEYDFSESYTENYEYCNDLFCSEITEYLSPNTNNLHKNILMKITGEFELDEKAYTDEINSLNKVITYYGSIEYLIDGKTYTSKTGSSPIERDSIDASYIEVPKGIVDAEEIKLLIQIRNIEYIFILK